jgi:hypothetical protein
MNTYRFEMVIQLEEEIYPHWVLEAIREQLEEGEEVLKYLFEEIENLEEIEE